MGIRAKILSGFLILATMLLVAGVWSTYELRHIGISVQKILDDNYKSISAAKLMIEALEREDSAILLLLLGNREEGREILATADTEFMEAYETARGNVTIPGEQNYVDSVIEEYEKYRDLWRLSIVGTKHEGDLEWYLSEIHSTFLNAKRAVKELMTLNDQKMYETASNLENRAHRATMPGMIAIVSAFVFALIFSFLINYYVVNPIIKITSGIWEYLNSGRTLDIKVETNDEISDLLSSVKSLIAKSTQ